MLRLGVVLRAGGGRKPRNTSVAPRYDTWNEKYEAWGLMRRMGKLAATGFYIPPDWYYHFRMFPPIQHNFQEEKTQNPHADPEPTQSSMVMDGDRAKLRDELARNSRTMATEGSRYMNLYWVQKPLDRMERRYSHYSKTLGYSHADAIKCAVREYHEEQSVRRRVCLIQSEEARASGKFITMKEAMSVLTVLHDAQRLQLAPHQFTELVKDTKERVVHSPLYEAEVQQRIVPVVKQPAAASDATTADPAAAAASSAASGVPPVAAATGTTTTTTGGSSTASALHDLLNAETQTIEEVAVNPSPHLGLIALSETATDATGNAAWYSGLSPSYSVPAASRSAGAVPSSKPPSS